ncbi:MULTISPECIES: DNA-processing protein DprA [unclassified Mesorhizobium]|uniref:DNA-processing protein DprA n=1 Tax=unclassified Mesorhizobium TaxID=325217 RepID=UPI000FE7BF6A|nr:MULTISPECIES: DNA-processing protein DprA [unclassified Mesorhizobium]TGT59839.1 DNA-protecting protein DprA [Mesorhizobium sp. M00.F.Ca.ET.170.01.1.1]RWB70273.1 MAG: DNA-protecting protein DprA [Mesorhizobium sp.]RWE26863.1 MAG: DNA-protecting protein DprA [Mesorhizobium sp.]RWE33317.1 MAG: DNA-protecting protein DprA [Mesorhizobium sp.]TGS68493.1 DNA-protecting protein DprA [Mesorhizobium sp. M3A.F.Ca.ET.201.01.1.1]
MSAPAAGPRLSDRQRLAWLRLIRTPNVGPASFRELVNRFGSAEAALEMLPELMISGGASRIARIPSIAEAESELEAARRAGARFVGIGEADYPLLLKTMDNPPPLLAMKGEGAVFRLPAVAIVGARNASLAGIKMARMLAADLGREGYGIVSGLARGIDTAAHQGSLSTGTVGVLAGGLDQPYPPENARLCDDIAERGGAVVSEMPFGWQPRAQDFPRRNRIVAGMALGLIVVEAAQRSGSLISARLANEMGRLVFAVPGSPLDPRAAGCNALLKDGVTLVTEAADVLGALAPLAGTRPPRIAPLAEAPDLSALPPPGENQRADVLEALGPTPIAVDDIIRHTGMSAAQIAMVLLELDLAGRLERHAGGNVSLVLGSG